MKEEKNTYYFLHINSDKRVFISLSNRENFEFLDKVITSYGFEVMDEKDYKSFKIDSQTTGLKISKATPSVMKKIGATNQYGSETFQRHGQYDVYCFSGIGILSKSELGSIWEMGLAGHGKGEEFEQNAQVMLMRFLSFAFADSAIVGFWGVSVDEGLVVMDKSKAKGEAIFIDLSSFIVYSKDGVKDLPYPLTILKLDPVLTEQTRQMKTEELVAFLLCHCTYFSLRGFTPDMKMGIMKLARTTTGIIYPSQNYIPRKVESAA